MAPPAGVGSEEPAILRELPVLEKRLQAHGFPPMSPWWRDQFVVFYTAGVRQLVLRVGRRGGKSSSLCRVAVLEALYGDHDIPPGDVGVVAIVSTRRDEAQQRLRTIRAILDALGEEYKATAEAVTLTSRPVMFKVFAANVAAVSGFTAIAIIADEIAKWRDEDTGANPATEVLAALRPTMATQRNARIFLSSSPLGTEDAHATAFALGTTEFQIAAHAESWVANPTVTEADTHALEPDPRIWAREYAAVPQAGVLGAFDPDDVARAFVPRQMDSVVMGRPVLILDVSSGKKDAWTWGVVRWLMPSSGVPILKFDLISGKYGAFWKELNAVDLVAQLANLAKSLGCATVHGDQREEFMVTGEFQKQGVAFFAHPWTASSKPLAVEVVRRWMREGALWLPEHDGMRKELLNFEERITPSGAFTFGARGSGHDDHVALLISAAMVHEERQYLYAPQPMQIGGKDDMAEYWKRVDAAEKKRRESEWWEE